jgi:hypothetical protein
MLRDVGYVLKKLDWMRAERIWPNGLRFEGRGRTFDSCRVRHHLKP